jgi:hypothetical protein
MQLVGRERRLIGPLTFLLGLVLAGQDTLAYVSQGIGLRISIDEQQVAFEVLLSNELATLLVPRARADMRLVPEEDFYRFLQPADQEGERKAFEDFLRDVCAVSIDGIEVKPIAEQLQFIPSQVAASAQEPVVLPSGKRATGDVMTFAAIAPGPDVRTVLVFPAKGAPRQVGIIWELFPEDPSRMMRGLDTRVELQAELDTADENKIIVFSPEKPVYTWRAPEQPASGRLSPVLVSSQATQIRIPVGSLAVLALGIAIALAVNARRRGSFRRWAAFGAIVAAVVLAGVLHERWTIGAASYGKRVEMPDGQKATEVFATLQRNVYRAFDYKTESDVYDVLAQSVDGDLLDRVYNEVYESLVMRDQGGAVARVRAVDVIEAELGSTRQGNAGEPAAFEVNARWRVSGSVYHWGHVHRRTNEYDARYTISQRGDRWKITELETLGQRRIPRPDDDPVVDASLETSGP